MAENEIQVLLTADFSKLAEGMQGGQEAVTQGSAEMQAALDASATGMTEAQAAIAESAEQAAARIREMVQSSLSLAESNGVAAQSERSLRESMGLRTEATAEQVAASQALVDAQTRQMVAAEGFIGAETAVADAEKAVTVATEEQTVALAVNGQVAREVGVLSGEALRGNWTRLEGSSITLANRMNLLQYAFTGTGLAVMGVVAAGAYVLRDLVEGEERAGRFESALMSTGYAAGMTADQLSETSDRIAILTGDAKGADEVMLKLAGSGRLSGQALVDAGTAAANIMRLTGESAEEAARQVEALGGDPVEAAVRLNEKFHFLTVELYHQIVALQEAGRAYEATELAAKSMAENTTDRVEKMREKMGYFELMFEHMKLGAVELDKDLRRTLDPTLTQQSDKATQDWWHTHERLNEAIKKNASPELIRELQGLEEVQRKNAQALRARVKAEEDSTDAKKKAAQAAQQIIDQEEEQRKFNAHLKETSLLQEKIAEAKARVEAIHKADPNSDTIKGITFDASGAVTGGEQWAATVAKLTKEYSNLAQEARRAAADAKKGAAEEIAQLETKRAETQAGTRERLDADQQVVVRSAQLYKTDSVEFQRALQEKTRDEQQYNANVLALRTQALEDARREAEGEIETQREQYQLQYQMGEINAKQLEQVEQQLVTRKLAIDLQYIQAKRALDAAAGDVAQAQKDDAALVAAKQKASQQLLRIDQQYHRNSEREWKNYAHRIEGSMATAFNAVIFQGQTLQNALLSVAETIAETFIQKGVQWLGQWIEDHVIAQTVATQTQGTAARINIASDAAAAAAGAFAATAAIPYVGPILAPAAATTAYAETMSFQAAVPSAAGGWDRVPADTLAQIHKDEMVLPADLAHAVRNMAGKGGAGGVHHHYHINALDARSFKDALRRNPGALAAAAAHAQRTGH